MTPRDARLMHIATTLVERKADPTHADFASKVLATEIEVYGAHAARSERATSLFINDVRQIVQNLQRRAQEI